MPPERKTAEQQNPVEKCRDFMAFKRGGGRRYLIVPDLLVDYRSGYQFEGPAHPIIAAYRSVMKLIVRTGLPVVARMIDW